MIHSAVHWDFKNGVFQSAVNATDQIELEQELYPDASYSLLTRLS